MLDNWQRLEQVIKWTGLSVNSFALTIGLKRSENLYQIKKGNNGISRDLAGLIAKKYPTISRGWLLSGEGTMFLDLRQPPSTGGVPYYAMDALEAVRENAAKSEPRFMIHIPLFADCDLAALCLGAAMQPDIPAGGIVMLKETELASLVPGETYLVFSPVFNGIRTIRLSGTPERLLLTPRNTVEYDPIEIGADQITGLYQVRGVITQKNG